MMLQKSYMPLPRLFLPLCAGIILFLVIDSSLSRVSLIYGAFSLTVTWFILHFSAINKHIAVWLHGCIISGLLVFVGFMLAQQHDQIKQAGHFSRHSGEEGYILARVIEPVSERVNSFRTVVSVETFGNDSLVHKVHGRLMVYFEKDSLAAAIHYGDVLLFENRYDLVSPPQNPYAFDYQSYLSRKNIFHSAYFRSGSWHLTGERRGVFIIRWALFLRGNALEIFSENHLSGREFAVVSALLLGYREYLDDDLRREFAGAGAMHVLCVSGLHVGIIFMVLKNLFAFLCRLPGGMLLRTLCILLFIWLYAAITGFSPSVLRASVMFSFVAVGQSFRRPTNIYNTLAASAFVLVLIDPYIITMIGFQLSYLAVISIVALQPPLYNLIKVKNKLLDKAWSIITVSIAAQLATGPLALFYFNQFPNYFLITNLVVIPLAGSIIYVSLLTLALSPIPFAGALMGKLLSFIVAFLHHSVRIIEGLPYSTATGIYLSFPETLLIFSLLITSCMFLMLGTRPALLHTLSLVLLLVVSFSMRNVKNSRQHHFVVYSANRATVVDFFAGKELLMLACNDMMDNNRSQEFTVAGKRLRHGHKTATYTFPLLSSDSLVNTEYWARKGDLLAFAGKTMLMVGSSDAALNYSRLDGRFETDYMLIVQNPRINPEALLEAVRPGKVIIDGSNSVWNASRWEDVCHESDVEVWNVRTQGAYISRNLN